MRQLGYLGGPILHRNAHSIVIALTTTLGNVANVFELLLILSPLLAPFVPQSLIINESGHFGYEYLGLQLGLKWAYSEPP